ncbi:hypothetical protein KZX46_02145 (plasmid) [Polymorphobacter sp. PAMC 29334]|uniref:hypothetical protein n=1 Tax=Polymorphobacter sp. PAMC 29334 TaxID=2862331 RepID=UPI001C742D2E|nr:hypothetical protein [Polymorphobacter sp. PAMC 29334]QYE32974.1 hypothetical protein KZX46_02145 [Polymorphobacter sp. PAMC 29334]
MGDVRTQFPRRQVIGLLDVGFGIAILVVWLGTYKAGGTLAIASATADRLLTSLAETAKFVPVGLGSETPADGTTAGTSQRDFVVSDIVSARRAVVAACAKQGLAAPLPNDVKLMPDIVCQGRWHDRDATAHVNGSCRSDCRIALETHLIR